jgi:methyl-accepting chemotaxis protein
MVSAELMTDSILTSKQLTEEQKSDPSLINVNDRRLITHYVPYREVPIIEKEMCCKELLSLMKKEADIPCVIVVDNKQPLGIIMRDNYSRHFTGRFAAALFYDKPVSIFADLHTLAVDLEMPVVEIINLAMMREDERFYDCLLVKEGEQIVGVLTIRDILSVMQQMQKEADEHRTVVVKQSYEGIHQIKHTVEVAVQEAMESISLTHVMNEWSGQGKVALEDVLLSYRAVEQKMKRQQKQMTALIQALENIEQMATSIRLLADQSGLLALNASIEAARAGEHGRGFQVVSHAVKDMFEQTKQFSAQITGLLGEIESKLNDTVTLSDQSMQQISDSAKYISAGSEAFTQLLQAAAQIESKNNEMSCSAKEAAQNAVMIADELEQMLH